MPEYIRIGFGSEPTDVGVAVKQGDGPSTFEAYSRGEIEDVFDISVHRIDEDASDPVLQQSIQAVDNCLTLANIGLRAIEALTALSDDYEVQRMRTYLFIVWNHELRDENNLLYCSYDPLEQVTPGVYTYDAAWVRERYSADVAEAAHEHLTGEDYESLDSLDGAEHAIERALDALKTPA